MELQVGDRVLIAKHKATVRYVGAVEGHDGVWVGVEWDDPGRGKHDGSTGGRRYFSCASGGPAGSLVRLAKVGRGAALEDALLARYTNRQGEGQAASGAADAAAFVSTSSSRKVWVQLVGEEQVVARLSQTELLASARLVGMGVSHVVRPRGAGAAMAACVRRRACWFAVSCLQRRAGLCMQQWHPGLFGGEGG